MSIYIYICSEGDNGKKGRTKWQMLLTLIWVGE